MKNGKNLVLGIVSITILVASLAFALVDAFLPLNLWVHPILNFFFGIFAGFGVTVLVLAIKDKATWYFFISAILLALAVLYVLIAYSVVWWTIIISIAVLLAVFAIVSVMVAGNMTEDISLNKSPDYKTFEQRKAEEKEKEQNQEKEEKPLPELKSFK